MLRNRIAVLLSIGLALALLSAPASAQRASDIANTRHNLSVSGPGEVTATSESQLCVFCHTPHSSNREIPSPLWNRDLSDATYTLYDSASLDATDLSEPAGASRLCLSCHDGTLAIGSVRNEPGRGGGSGSISMQGTADGGTMPPGAGTTTGYTRDLGVNLTNDHPISFTYDSALASADGELRDPSLEAHIGIRAGDRPLLPLEDDGSGNGLLQCTTCHDPHINEPGEYNKFLRVNRFQVNPAGGGAFSEDNDQICLACHDKLGEAWASSAHADPSVADQVYKDGPADIRQFPRGLQVWQVGCLNCHNPHTTEGARRLLREGTDSTATPKVGGSSAIEETCYQCHTTSLGSIVEGGTGTVPDIRSDFQLARRMPITTADQPANSEVHDIRDADFTESRTTLGYLNPDNRHAECTDCHNPHRVMRDSLFTGTRNDGRRTHVVGGPDGNLASGVLRGTFGVEPVYGSESFFDLPMGYTEKRGDGGIAASTDVGSSWVTREYQICLKCHSDFAYEDDNVYPSGSTRPPLGGPGLTSPSDTQRSNYTRYTNQAREFQAPLAHQGNPGSMGSAAGASYNSNNHRSWHPVMEPTGRTASLRNSMNSSVFRPPWNQNIGNQTMYCSDCHGANTPAGQHEPSTGQAWGPHGSQNNFLLKGLWNTSSGSGQGNALCFKCHDQSSYAGSGSRTGFRTSRGDGHEVHSSEDKMNRTRCNWCHVAVPHGWKNKSLLVNLNDVGPEVGLAPGTRIPNNQLPYSNGPYYRNAMLKIRNFRQNANWSASDCGPTSGDIGETWMTEVCMNPP
ncbi:cytochrome c3 family protein [Halomonas alkalisoli]|uniref:cytochrome c3 family protein n=1 Tax=Halomonas alkalisoli TaxID=2907158 RepID=UPI001F323BCD|nr:cytochrome c3 family protein [Halomonas alkalisoli]MCE9682602.1 hypothetical protein [Halomonas alkalisoli]